MNFEYLLFRTFPKDAWHALVHVCKRRRSIVFASPRRLKLQPLCTNIKHVQNTLDILPELPIVIGGRVARLVMSIGKWGSLRATTPVSELYTNDIISGLEQHNRVANIHMFYIPH
jgi:hypothetical protein